MHTNFRTSKVAFERYYKILSIKFGFTREHTKIMGKKYKIISERVVMLHFFIRNYYCTFFYLKVYEELHYDWILASCNLEDDRASILVSASTFFAGKYDYSLRNTPNKILFSPKLVPDLVFWVKIYYCTRIFGPVKSYSNDIIKHHRLNFDLLGRIN